MKLPKTVIICGHTFEVRINPKDRGGWFSCSDKIIEIGTKDMNDEEITTLFLHEVQECIYADTLVRYKLPYTESENGHYLFNFNHLQFELMISHLRLAIKDILK